MNNSVLGKTMGNVKKCKNINYLESKTKLSYKKTIFRKLVNDRNETK